MKLSQFRALCVREWEQEGNRGDVIALQLTDDSLAELEADLLVDPDERFRSVLDPFALVNPITRSFVRVAGGDTWDWFEVRRPVPYKLLEPADTIPA